MKLRRTAALAIGVLFALSSCKKSSSVISEEIRSQDAPIAVDQGRLVFKNVTTFNEALTALNKTGSLKGIPGKETGFLSLNTALEAFYLQEDAQDKQLEALADFNFTPGHLSLLNSKGEIQIGNEIIWYQNNMKYYISAEKRSELAYFKANPDKVEKKLKAGSKVLPVYENGSREIAADYFNMGFNAGDARHQYEFVQQTPIVGNRKYVHEVISFFEGYSDGFFYYWATYLTLRIKLEWKGKKWRPASELRNISTNLAGTATVNVPGQGAYFAGPNISFNTSVQANSDYVLLLGQFNGSGTLGTAYWTLNLYGSITHHIVGDVIQNQWTNAGTAQAPLW